MPLVLGEMAGLLVTPGGAVAVLQHELHLHPPPVGGDQMPGQAWQRQLLNGHQQAGVSTLNRINDHLLKVITVAPMACQG